MRRLDPSRTTPALLALAIAACGAVPSPRTATEPKAPASPPAAADPPATPAPSAAASLPVRGEGPPLPPPDRELNRIAFGWCSLEDQPLPVFAAVAAARPDLFVFAGGAVCGADLARAPDPEGSELRRAYVDLNLNAHFAAFNMSTPMLATWSERDMGPGGTDQGGRELSERMFEAYWGAAALGAERPGVHGSRLFGPVGRRVQLLLLDMGSLRSEAGGSTAAGEDHWRWLAGELRRPAEIRLIVSPTPVLTERRLLDTLRTTQAKGVVLLTGGGPANASRAPKAVPYVLHQLTPSPLTAGAFAAGGPAGFGLVEIDWRRRTVTLSARRLDGAVDATVETSFRALGH